MSDRYQQFTKTSVGKLIATKLGLPRPAVLRRYESGQPLLAGPAWIGFSSGGRWENSLRRLLVDAGVEVLTDSSTEDSSENPAAAIFDATGIKDPKQLREIYEFLHPVIKRIAPSGRVVVLGTPPELVRAHERIAQRALEGFVRSVGKELKRGATAQLIYVAEGAEAGCESTLRFILSAKSAFVDGQVIRVGAVTSAPSESLSENQVDWEKPLTGKVALVTGAAQGIGAAIAGVLARDGAHVVALDIPSQGDRLSTVANSLQGSALQLDITSNDAAARLAEYLLSRHGGVDVVVHNAGITRDKTLGNMDSARWDGVLSVNLLSQIEINRRLMEDRVINENGRIIGVSSIAGIAGNVGQTNYATSKAGVIGIVDVLAPLLADRGVTVNTVAPGFIETKMTAAVPLMIREVGRRLSSLAQGGLPVDVAETIAWLANPASTAVSGNVVRVCGQAFLGA